MSVERSTMPKVYWRLLPLTILVYFLCYLDRTNVGFAALTMNKDLGLDAATYGMAAGAFFWGYFLFEVPSNIILEKLGAGTPRWGAYFARSLIRAAAGFRSRADDRRRLLTHETAKIETALSLLWFAAIQRIERKQDLASLAPPRLTEHHSHE